MKFSVLFQIARNREPGNQVLRHSVPVKIFLFSIFHQILEALGVECRNSTPYFFWLPELVIPPSQN